MEYIYWNVRALSINGEKHASYSPQFTSTKDAELWKMKYIIEHPDDIILFDLMEEGDKPFTTDIGRVVSDMWAGHELSSKS